MNRPLSASPQASPFRGWTLFFCGVCMGAADLVPGISGGTIAFILGFYQPLLESLKTLNWNAFKLLFQGRGGDFARQVEWKFLLTLISGIGFSFVFLANLFHFILSQELLRIYFYAVFLGLILASFVFCIRQVGVWNYKTVSGLCAGIMIAFFLTESTLSPSMDAPLKTSFFNAWLIFCGSLAVCALLLPGISGSYLLTLLGVYPLVIEALADFLNGAAVFSFRFEAFETLASLGAGIVLGAIAFARGVSWLLREYSQVTLAVLSGFMIGAIRSVWPFWSYDYIVMPLKMDKGPQLITVDPYIPDFTSPLIWQAALCTLAGFVLVFGLESYVRRKSIDSTC